MKPAERIEAAAERSPLVRAALEQARSDHAGQVRNGSGGMPYIEHPVRVAALLDERDCGEEVLAAALLHDVVEDSDTTLDELGAAAQRQWVELGGDPGTLELGAERNEFELPARAAKVAATAV